jgi:Protein of unknown function (DUF2591)
MKVKTSELTGPALDWAVAKCEGRLEEYPFSAMPSSKWYYSPSTHWMHGGKIIEREGIGFWKSGDKNYRGQWAAAPAEWMEVEVESPEFDSLPDPTHGPTPLIAAMRCFVASKLGDTVEVPDSLF